MRWTLDILTGHIDLELHEVPTGTRVFRLGRPKEWNIRAASIKGVAGCTILDFADSNLHVMDYSIPMRALMPLTELREYIHTLSDQPDLIP